MSEVKVKQNHTQGIAVRIPVLKCRNVGCIQSVSLRKVLRPFNIFNFFRGFPPAEAEFLPKSHDALHVSHPKLRTYFVKNTPDYNAHPDL